MKVDRSGTVNNGVNACYGYDRADNRSNVTVATTGSCSPAAGVTFSISDVAIKEGGDLVFTVTKTGTASDTITLDYATANAGAIAGPDYTAKSGTLTFLVGDTSKTVNVTTLDDSGVESDEAVLLGLFNVSAGGAIADGQGIGTIQDNDLDCAGVTYTIATNGAVEEGNNSVFTVTKAGSTSSSCSVNYASSNGPSIPQATTPGDYTATSGTLTFASGQTSQTINVPTTEDTAAESSENLTMTLSAPNRGAALGSPSSAMASITDDDLCIGVSYTVSSSGTVTEGGGIVFTVTKNGASGFGCFVDYATANGSAAAPGDYTAASGTLSFTSVQTSKTVTVNTVDDAGAESAETFSFSLSNPVSGATLGTPSSATGTITDNDSGGACSGVSYSVNDPATVIEGNPLVFTVSKAGTTSSSCSISYATANGTGVAPTHYTATSGTPTFTSAQTSKTVTVTTIDNALPSGTKTMYLNLTTATDGASITDSQGLGRMQHSDDPGGGGCPTC